MIKSREQSILTALRTFPGGCATAIQVANKLSWKATSASRHMGMLFFTNVLSRETVKRESGRQFVYWERADVPAPTLVAWDGPVLLAASRMRDRETV